MAKGGAGGLLEGEGVMDRWLEAWREYSRTRFGWRWIDRCVDRDYVDWARRAFRAGYRAGLKQGHSDNPFGCGR